MSGPLAPPAGRQARCRTVQISRWLLLRQRTSRPSLPECFEKRPLRPAAGFL